VTAADAEPVHGHRGDGGAVAGVSGSARRASAAADLKRNDYPVSGAYPHHVLAYREDLGDAFVAEVER
jgi:hypothetical protein